MSLLSILDNVKHAVASPFESKSQPQTAGVKAMDASDPTSGSGTTSPTDSATITANDFLTLLVTEIQNQDPTQQTDPMQYITQLVGVNSLEQLVQINQTLGGSSGATNPAAQAVSSPVSSPAVVAKPSAAVSSAASKQGSQPPASAARQLLPLGSNTQIPTAAETAVAHAFTHASTLPAQVLPPTQVPMNPEVMRALEHSIPGATFTGQVPLPSTTPPGTGGATR